MLGSLEEVVEVREDGVQIWFGHEHVAEQLGQSH